MTAAEGAALLDTQHQAAALARQVRDLKALVDAQATELALVRAERDRYLAEMLCYRISFEELAEERRGFGRFPI